MHQREPGPCPGVATRQSRQSQRLPRGAPDLRLQNLQPPGDGRGARANEQMNCSCAITYGIWDMGTWDSDSMTAVAQCCDNSRPASSEASEACGPASFITHEPFYPTKPADAKQHTRPAAHDACFTAATPSAPSGTPVATGGDAHDPTTRYGPSPSRRRRCQETAEAQTFGAVAAAYVLPHAALHPGRGLEVPFVWSRPFMLQRSACSAC